MRDADMRRAVKAHLQLLHEDDSTTRIVEEMGVWSGTVRVDIAVINGELNGFELKSDSDTLERLPSQIEIYGKVFDRMTLVVGGRHYKKALSRIPDWWGCIIATMESGQVSLIERRKAKRNPSPDPHILAQLLWKGESLMILEKYGFAKGWRDRRSNEIADRLVNKLSYRRLAASVREALKARTKLGQLSSGNLDMTIDAITDPTGGTSGGRRRIGDSIDHLVAKGIRVNAVAPGPVWTPLNPSDKEAEDVSKFGAQAVMKRPAQPEEIAPAFVFLASSHCSSYITGEILPVIGGY